MTEPRNYISLCMYCGHSFNAGDNARCVSPAQFVHLHCLGTWTTLKAMESLQERARVRLVG
jgi:hypothetical protein